MHQRPWDAGPRKFNNAQPNQHEATEWYLLQIDRQTNRSFKMPEAAWSMGLDIKGCFPALQVSIYDNMTQSRTVVEVSKSA